MGETYQDRILNCNLQLYDTLSKRLTRKCAEMPKIHNLQAKIILGRSEGAVNAEKLLLKRVSWRILAQKVNANAKCNLMKLSGGCPSAFHAMPSMRAWRGCTTQHLPDIYLTMPSPLRGQSFAADSLTQVTFWHWPYALIVRINPLLFFAIVDACKSTLAASAASWSSWLVSSSAWQKIQDCRNRGARSG